MNVQGNLYTFIYASILVIVVAAGLSFVAIKLQPLQEKNIKEEKMKNILTSVHIDVKEGQQVQKIFDKYIVNSFVINTEGEIKQSETAFDIHLKEELDKKPENRNYPVFECKLDNGEKKIIVPVRGKGLWGPIWGYIALNDDYNTIFGVVFDHKAETPGLGAEISTEKFQEQFEGKKLFEDGEFVSIEVLKGGKAEPEALHEVDAITGGTITSLGVQDMLHELLKDYVAFFNQKK